MHKARKARAQKFSQKGDKSIVLGVLERITDHKPFHLFRYVDEQAFRFNTRKNEEGKIITDHHRFKMAIAQIVDKRLTYAQLTGKQDQRPEAN